MRSFQSALMSWRDKGFSTEHLDEGATRKVNRVIEEMGSDCQVVRDMVINDIQRIEQSMKDRDAVFYTGNPPTMFDRHLNTIDMSQYPETWVKIVGEESLSNLEDLKELLEGIE